MNCLATTLIITCKIPDMAVAIDPFSDKFPYFNRSSQRCRLQSLTNLDFNFLVDENIHRSVSSPCFSIAASSVRALVAEVTMAMVSGAQPLLLPSGMGGAYLLQTGKGYNIAVAKPVGETGIRELAAYLLDYQGFSGVPPTALVSISHVPFHVSDAFQFSSMPYKVASLQRFVSHDFDAGELGPGSFTVTSVHRIGILDVRVLNLDRHAGNMLVKRCEKKECYNVLGTAELVPIDHGLCLPECLDDPYFEWLNWPQAFVPFTDTELQYIANLDPFKDAELLRTELHSLPESAIRVLIVCTVFLKQAAAAGLCLAEIGEKMTRDFSGGEESFSLLETIAFEAEISEVFHVSKPPLVPRGPRTNTIPTNVNEKKRGCTARSKSPPICANHDESSKVVSFVDMTTDEWDMFLQIFQTLLEDALSKGSTPKLGCSLEKSIWIMRRAE